MRPSRIRITTAAADIIVIPSAVSAIGKTIDPVVLQGSITFTPTEASAIGKSLNPIVIISGGDNALMFGTNF